MDRPDARTGQHGERAFRNHGHVDRHPVTLFNAHLFQGVGHADHFFLKLRIGNVAAFSIGIVGFEDQRDPVPLACSHMTIDSIVADVQLAIFEPSDVDRIIAPTCDPGRFLTPFQALGLVGPEIVTMFDAAGIQALVIFCIAGGLGGDGLRPANPVVRCCDIAHYLSPPRYMAFVASRFRRRQPLNLQIRQILIGKAPSLERFRLCAVQQLLGLVDRKGVGILHLAKLVPGQRDSDRCAGSRAR